MGRSTRVARGLRASQLAEVSVPSRRGESKASVDQATEDEVENEEEDGDAMEEDDNESKASISKGTARMPKSVGTKKSARRSGRKK